MLYTTRKQKLHTELLKMTFHPLDSNQRVAEHDQCSLKALEWQVQSSTGLCTAQLPQLEWRKGAADTIQNSAFDTWLPLGWGWLSKIVYLQEKKKIKKEKKFIRTTFLVRQLSNSYERNARKEMLPGGNAGVSWKHCLTTQIQQKFDIKSYLCLSFSE